MKVITRNIWILSLISLFTDTASEMLYPIMPVYLKSIGFSILLIGILEGFAEATAGLSKGYFGKLSDSSGKRIPFVQIGYSLSAISKPIMGFFINPLWIFFSRTLDRLGKGIRTGARDAVLSDESTTETKGRVFGFHRSMDTFGAVLGPSLALLYLYYYPNDYKTLFFIAFAPGIISIIISFMLKEKNNEQKIENKRTSFFVSFKYWRVSSKQYKKLVAGLLFFALFNSSDVFLLLEVKQAGLSDTAIIGVYIFYNLVYAIFAFPLGILADKIGLKTVLIAGLLLFSGVYVGMAFNTEFYGFVFLFFVYGLYAAATEGISKAMISNYVSKNETATAIGTFAGFQSVFALFASTIAGMIWYFTKAKYLFIISGCAALGVALYFCLTSLRPSALSQN